MDNYIILMELQSILQEMFMLPIRAINAFRCLFKSVFPVANFSSNVTSGVCSSVNVQFNDSSENATEWNWDFGDGDNSTSRIQMHTFSAAGNYTVNLTASNANGTDSFNATITVLKVTPGITWNDPEDIVYGARIERDPIKRISFCKR